MLLATTDGRTVGGGGGGGEALFAIQGGGSFTIGNAGEDRQRRHWRAH
jgi:hypothetical protein